MMLDKTFQYFDDRENSNKTWRVQFDGTQMTTWWGRVGQTLQTKTKPATFSQVEKLIWEKQNKGYRLVEKDVVRTVEVAAPTNPRVGKYLGIISRAANTSIENYLAVPTDNLALSQIERGRTILKQIAATDDRAWLVKEYYRTIPTKLPHRIDPKELVRDFDPDEQDTRLNQLEAAVGVNVEVTTSAPFELDAAPDAEEIEKLVVSTARHSDRQFKIKDVLSVLIRQERRAYEQCDIGNEKIFFHGTRAGNIAHILRSGLLVPPYASHGRAFGDGIYFADVSTKSIGYCDSYDGTRFLLVARVKLGNPYVPAGSYEVSNWKKPKEGYHSVAAIARTTSLLAHSEYVVYNKSQQTITHLVVL